MKLSDIPKKNIFSTSDAYFEKLSSDIMKKTEEKEILTKTQWFRQPVFQLASTFVFLLFVGVALYLSQQKSENTISEADKILVNIEEEEINEYLYYSNLETNEIIELLVENNSEITPSEQYFSVEEQWLEVNTDLQDVELYF